MTGPAQPQVLRYGTHESQYVEVTTPAGDPKPGAVVLIHGGWWRHAPTLSLRHMDGLTGDLVGRGFRVVNLEYRRIDAPGADGGWPTTLKDVIAGIDAALEADSIEVRSVVAAGHSAGGHLALLAAAELGLGGVVAQAPITDLPRCAAAGLGEGATPIFMGGDPEARPEEYRLASPLHRLPIGCPQLFVHGTDDVRVPIEHSRDYLARAREVGDDVDLHEVAGGDHMFVLDPTHPYWERAVAWIDTRTAEHVR